MTDTIKKYGFQDIAAALIEDINSGKIKAGEYIPSENALVKRFSVSRNTVREALRKLSELGYIDRRQGARSILLSESPDMAYINSISSVEQLLLYSTSIQSQLLSSEIVVADENLAEKLSCAAGTTWMRFILLRYKAGQKDPIFLSEIFVSSKYIRFKSKFEESSTMLGVLEGTVGIVFDKIDQEFEAYDASADAASRLNVDIGSAIMRVRTKFFSAEGELVEVSIAHYPQGRFPLRVKFRRHAT